MLCLEFLKFVRLSIVNLSKPFFCSKSILLQISLCLYLFIVFYVGINFAVSNTLGDSSTYQYWYVEYLNTDEWVKAIGNEPLFSIALNVSSYFGVNGLKIFVAFAIALGFCLFKSLANIYSLSLYLYPLIFFTPLSTFPIFLCTAWRSSLASFAFILFIYFVFKCPHKGFNRLHLRICRYSFFFISFTSHSSGIAITALFLMYNSFLKKLIPRLAKFKVNTKFIYCLLALPVVIPVLSLINLPGTTYIHSRMITYLYFNTSEVKDFYSFTLKICLLIMFNLVVSRFSLRHIDEFYNTFLTYTTFVYIVSFVLGLVVPVLIPDRIVNVLYNYTLILMLDLFVHRLRFSLFQPKHS